jgi:ribosomal 50S subunit-recycling heat shock protein
VRGGRGVTRRAARPSIGWVAPGRRVAVRYPSHTLEVEVLAIPGKNVSKKGARELYRVLRDDPAGGDAV